MKNFNQGGSVLASVKCKKKLAIIGVAMYHDIRPYTLGPHLFMRLFSKTFRSRLGPFWMRAAFSVGSTNDSNSAIFTNIFWNPVYYHG